MVRATSVRDRKSRDRHLPRRRSFRISRGRADHVFERSEPRSEDRSHFFIALHVNSADLARAVVEVEVAGELLVIRFQLELRRRLLLGWRSACTGRAAAESWSAADSFAEVIAYVVTRA